MVRREEYEYLMRRSREFCETAVLQIERGFYGLAALSLEQCLQLHLKARLLEAGMDYPRTHSVRRLLELLGEVLGESVRVEKVVSRFSVELAALEDAYITSRYVPRDFRRDEVLRLKSVVEEVMRVVGEIVGGGG